jgi:hypothetical protein
MRKGSRNVIQAGTRSGGGKDILKKVLRVGKRTGSSRGPISISRRFSRLNMCISYVLMWRCGCLFFLEKGMLLDWE